jgi:hypothetical protein
MARVCIVTRLSERACTAVHESFLNLLFFPKEKKYAYEMAMLSVCPSICLCAPSFQLLLYKSFTKFGTAAVPVEAIPYPRMFHFLQTIWRVHPPYCVM